MKVSMCSECGGEVATRSTLLPITAFRPPPRQRERSVRITRWQCLVNEDHSGEFNTATDEVAR